jgi:hypothetical protein
MPRFHYVLRTDHDILLSDSIDLLNLEAARVEASRRVGYLLQTHAQAIWVDREWQMEVTDEVGLILFVISVSAMKSAATQSTNRALSDQQATSFSRAEDPPPIHSASKCGSG